MNTELYNAGGSGRDPELNQMSHSAIRRAMKDSPLSYLPFAAKSLIREDTRAAVKLMSSAMENVPEPKWSFLYIKAQALFEAEEFEKAAECAEQAHRLQPRHHEIFVLRISIEGARGRFKEGIRLGREGLLYFANSLALKTALLKLHFESGDFLQAAQLAVILLSTGAIDDSKLYEMLAESLTRHSRGTGKIIADEEWIGILRRGIEKYPESFSLNYFFANFYFAHNNAEEGCVYARKAAEILPDNLHARLSAAVILYAAGKPAEAVEYFRQLDNIGFRDDVFFRTYYLCLSELEMTEELDALRLRMREINPNLSSHPDFFGKG
jgi:tetratricopeptide (TPR) repeat protein